MRILAAVFLLLTALPLNAAGDDEVYVGKVLEVSQEEIELDLGGSEVSIGFVADADVQRLLEKVSIGSEVRVVLGSAPGPDGPAINKLVSIRNCTRSDEECAAGRRQQQEQFVALMRRADAFEQEQKVCHEAMEASLAKDARYVPETSTPAERKGPFPTNALTGEAQACAAEFLEQHQAAFHEACELHHCGDRIAGGCGHMTGYARTHSAGMKAVEVCQK